jgi:hypothetical protein
VGIDLLAVGVVIPLLTVIPAFGTAFVIRLLDHSCAPPCDGLALIGISIWFLLVMVFSVIYWPVFALWRRQTIGSRLLGLRYGGTGLRRRLIVARPASQRPTTDSE